MSDLSGLTVGGHSITTSSLSSVSVSMASNPQTVITVVGWSQTGGTATRGEIITAHGLSFVSKHNYFHNPVYSICH